jgi:SOS-response transcriptional repressor LexA
MTPKQRRTLDFVAAFIDEHGFSPTLDEIAIELGLRSKSGVSRILEALQAQALIETTPGRARSIKIVPQYPAGVHVIKSAIVLYDEDVCSAEATIDAIRATIRSMELMP